MSPLPFLTVTAIAVIVGHWWSWSAVGPLGSIVVVAILYPTLRVLRKRLDRGSSQSVTPPEVLWTLVAFCTLFAGGMAGFMASNPDGYMQSRPAGAPWGLIVTGSVVGVAIGGVLARALSRLTRSD